MGSAVTGAGEDLDYAEAGCWLNLWDDEKRRHHLWGPLLVCSCLQQRLDFAPTEQIGVHS